MQKNILLISHDATLTGAPILLLNLADAIKESSNTQIKFLIKNKELQLLDKFEKLAPTFIAAKKKFSNRFFNAPFSTKEILKALEKVDVIISNTITNGDILPVIRKYFKGPIISYIHEMEMAAANFTNTENITALKNCTDYYLVPSKAVATYLETKQGVDKNLIDVLPYYIKESAKQDNAVSKNDSQFRIGAAGTNDWRKGPDVFIQIAAEVLKKNPEAAIQFTWKGATNGVQLERINYDIQKMGLQHRVKFELVSDNMNEFYSSLDVFLLTSREDPYPLVVLEAASRGVPSICFSGAGGAEEFILNEAGLSVNYLDIGAATEAILFYYNNRNLKTQHGQAAKKKLGYLHSDAKKITSKLENIFQKVFEKKNHSTK